MNLGMTASSLLPAALAAFGGLILGIGYFLALRRTTALLAGGRGWVGPAGLTLARIAVAAVLFGFAARLGALPLLTGFAGFLLARAIALRSIGRLA
jgi:hypothetical protein